MSTGSDITAWIGREQVETDVLRHDVAAGLTAAIASAPLDLDALAPPLVHWLCFQPIPLQSALGEDGHPRRGDFLPPVTLPRRMWAAGAVEFLRPIALGSALTRHSTIADVRRKIGRSGALVFVQVDHAISDASGPVLRERQDIVYRDITAAPVAPQPAPDASAYARTLSADPVLLFRYSALSGNTHRIHYDYPYATTVEHYPGLVVHGPLIATLLLHAFLAEHPGAQVRRFSFRAVRPAFAGQPLRIAGGRPNADGVAHLFAADAANALCMDATATFA